MKIQQASSIHSAALAQPAQTQRFSDALQKAQSANAGGTKVQPKLATQVASQKTAVQQSEVATKTAAQHAQASAQTKVSQQASFETYAPKNGSVVNVSQLAASGSNVDIRI